MAVCPFARGDPAAILAHYACKVFEDKEVS
jgi:hypothetical protein